MEQASIIISPDGSENFKFAFPPGSNTYTMMIGAQFVRDKGTRVLFTGHGGDEGVSHRCNVYELFYNHEYYHYWRNIWSLNPGRRRVIRTLKKGFKNITSSIRDNRETYLNWFASPELLKADFSKGFRKQKENTLKFAFDPVAYIRDDGSRNRLDNLALFGACSGVRYLIPYLDYRVIDYAVSIPRHLYMKHGVKRYIFRQAFKDIMPRSLYSVRIKEDTSVTNIKPDENWYEEYSRRKQEIIGALDRHF
nr:asparagine synthase C-terminal domain-containing protein [Butyrivibrio sp. WCE2006]